MCLGLPMTVVMSNDSSAVVEGWGERRTVGTLLAGDVTPGMIVLVHKNDAIRILDEEEAASLTEAVRMIVQDAREPG